MKDLSAINSDSDRTQSGVPDQPDTRMLWLGVLLALLAYTLITAVLFWPIVRHITSTFPVDLGDPPNESWLVAWGVHALTTDPSQLLGGNIYYPHANALVYNDNMLGLLPLSTPLFLASSGNAAFTYNALYLISFILCGIGAYLLAHQLTGSAAGALLAGVIVAYCPYRMVHLSHLNQLSGQWVLFVLLFWERARRAADPDNPRRLWPELAAMGVFFVLQALCSIYYAVFLSTCLILYLALAIGASGWHRTRRFTRGIAITAMASGAALLPALLPYIHLQERIDTVRGPLQVLYFSADVRDFLHMPAFSVLYGWTERALGVPLHDAHQYLFPGLIALALAVLGWRWRRERLEPRIYAVLLLVTAVFSLGRQLKLFDQVYRFPLPFALLYDHVPGFRSFRDPARFFYIGYICLALLAAWGMAGILERCRVWPTARRNSLITLLVVAALAEYWIAPVATPSIAVGNSIPPVYRWLKVQPAHTAVLELPIGQQNATIWSQQAQMTYYATYHWQPIINGVGGYTPNGYEQDAAVLNRWPDPAARRLLSKWNVHYVIWHAHWVGKPGPRSSASTPLVINWPDGDSVYRASVGP